MEEVAMDRIDGEGAGYGCMIYGGRGRRYAP